MTSTKTTIKDLTDQDPTSIQGRCRITGWQCTTNPDGTITERTTYAWEGWPSRDGGWQG